MIDRRAALELLELALGKDPAAKGLRLAREPAAPTWKATLPKGFAEDLHPLNITSAFSTS
jgi:hypothetical protein